MKKTIALGAIAAALLMLAGIAAAAQYQAGANNRQQQQQQSSYGTGKMQRYMNQIRDMLGICQGGCLLEELSGVFTYDGANFYIASVELHFGPIFYVTSATSAVDYDEDGDLELIIDELLGLVDTEVTVEGHYQSEDWMSVFTINGEIYREPGQPIWTAQHQWCWQNEHQNNQP